LAASSFGLAAFTIACAVKPTAEDLANEELIKVGKVQRVDPRRVVPIVASPPLVAFNIELAPPASLEDARAIAARIREGGPEGLPGVRAIGLWLEHRGVAQVSTNVEEHRAAPLAILVEAIERHATPVRAELVGLAPRAAFDGFPPDLPVDGKRLIEDVLAQVPARD